eukprot:3468565-Lingulodinium_polyedra.AAC.1
MSDALRSSSCTSPLIGTSVTIGTPGGARTHVGPEHLCPLWYHGGTTSTRIVACTAIGIHTTA